MRSTQNMFFVHVQVISYLAYHMYIAMSWRLQSKGQKEFGLVMHARCHNINNNASSSLLIDSSLVFDANCFTAVLCYRNGSLMPCSYWICTLSTVVSVQRTASHSSVLQCLPWKTWHFENGTVLLRTKMTHHCGLIFCVAGLRRLCLHMPAVSYHTEA